MLSPQALMRAFARRVLPGASVDSVDNDVTVRLWSRGEFVSIPLLQKQSGLAEEGSYFTASNLQTSITGPAGTAFSATAAMLTIYNASTLTAPVRIVPDYLHLLAGTTAMSNTTSNTGTFWSMVIDSVNRYTSGGTALTPKNVNMESTNGSVAVVNFGALTTTAASGAVRSIIGNRLFREPVSATALSLASMDDWQFNFGALDAPSNIGGSSGVLQANIVHKIFNTPPVVIGPGQTLVLHMWLTANSGQTGGTFLPELGWYER
jgi:hypothetical protein